LFIAAPAAAQSLGEKTGANAMLGVAPTTEDFVLQAAQSDMFEVQSSELAANGGGDATKDFANQMVEAHKKTTEELSAALKGGVKATLPTDMSSAQKSMLDDLKGRKGDDLSDQYVDDQVSAHKEAVSLFQRYADGGDNPELKAWAAKTLPELKHHLEMAQALNK
jgi:putative membrane protein